MTRGILALSDFAGARGTTDGVAAKFACSRCISNVERYKNTVGGNIFVPFGCRKVLVHLARKDGKGTEQWAEFAQGQGWSNPFGSTAVNVCTTNRRNQALVAIDSTPVRARAACN